MHLVKLCLCQKKNIFFYVKLVKMYLFKYCKGNSDQHLVSLYVKMY